MVTQDPQGPTLQGRDRAVAHTLKLLKGQGYPVATLMRAMDDFCAVKRCILCQKPEFIFLGILLLPPDRYPGAIFYGVCEDHYPPDMTKVIEAVQKGVTSA
jgi:hypothetical protein